MNLNFLSNVFLDAYPFGSLNTALECLEEGLPIISWPTNKTNALFVKGFYTKMGIGDRFLVNSMEEYVEKAIKTAKISGEERESLKMELKERSKVLFNDMSAVADWKRLLISLLYIVLVILIFPLKVH
jgi:predicted O-linked N-acetylglucosamine transferase (SPINDLY family)